MIEELSSKPIETIRHEVKDEITNSAEKGTVDTLEALWGNDARTNEVLSRLGDCGVLQPYLVAAKELCSIQGEAGEGGGKSGAAKEAAIDEAARKVVAALNSTISILSQNRPPANPKELSALAYAGAALEAIDAVQTGPHRGPIRTPSQVLGFTPVYPGLLASKIETRLAADGF